MRSELSHSRKHLVTSNQMPFKKIAATFLMIILALVIGGVIASTGYPSALSGKRYDRPIIRIDNVRLISMDADRPQVEINQSVLVINGEITDVGTKADLLDLTGGQSPNLQIIDGKGQTLMPGLIDAHVHVWDEAELAGFLVHGVTSIRNMSGMPFHVPLAQRIREGIILGPDFLTTGPILNSPGANANDIQVLVTTADEAREAVRSQFKRGFRQLKVYSNLTPEAYAAIQVEAAALGMTIVGHTPEGVRSHGVPHSRPFEIPFDDILDDGFQTIEHVESIVWHGLRDQLDADQMRILAQKIKDSQVVITPTLIAHDNLVRVAASKGVYLDRPGANTLNPLYLMLDKGTRTYWSRQDPNAREAPRAEFYRQATGILHEAGVPMITGTDAGIFTNIPGSSLTRELELLVASGLTPYDALRAATVVAGPAIGLTDRGQISPGFRANLILVSDDPLVNVSTVENPTAVMVGGVFLDQDALSQLAETAGQSSILRTGRRLIEMKLAQ
jgi:Amidohydrolase family